MLLDKMGGNRLLFWGIENVRHFCVIMSFRVGIRITDIYSRILCHSRFLILRDLINMTSN